MAFRKPMVKDTLCVLSNLTLSDPREINCWVALFIAMSRSWEGLAFGDVA